MVSYRPRLYSAVVHPIFLMSLCSSVCRTSAWGSGPEQYAGSPATRSDQQPPQLPQRPDSPPDRLFWLSATIPNGLRAARAQDEHMGEAVSRLGARLTRLEAAVVRGARSGMRSHDSRISISHVPNPRPSPLRPPAVGTHATPNPMTSLSPSQDDACEHDMSFLGWWGEGRVH